MLYMSARAQFKDKAGYASVEKRNQEKQANNGKNSKLWL